MKLKLITSVITILSLYSCCWNHDSDYNKIAQSVFIEDANSPNLPIYSEWGYNTFGVYLDRTPFVSERYSLPIKIIVQADTCHIQMKGEAQGMAGTLTFSFPKFIPQKYEDLVALNGKSYDLQHSKECVVFFTDNNHKERLSVTEGEIEFKKVQKLYVDKELTRSVLSGIFEFKTFINKEPKSFTFGRFDLGVGEENFFFIKDTPTN